MLTGAVVEAGTLGRVQGKSLVTYFVKNRYRTIAFYGMSYAGVNIITMEDELEDVGAVVTAVTFFRKIEKWFSDKVDCPIISLENVLYEV